MSNIIINGTSMPFVGVKEIYSVLEINDTKIPQNQLNNDNNNVFKNQIKWFLYVLDRGNWRLAKGNEKIGQKVDFTFTQTSLKWKEMKIIVHAYGQKAMIDIKPQKASQGKILHVDLLDYNYNIPTKPFVYGDWIIARVHCVDMEFLPVKVILWEDDGDKAKQNTTNVKIEIKQADVLNGKADVAFYLDPSNAWLANAKLAPRDKNEGEFHEYYVTAEIFEKVSKRVPSKNANVPNPDYKTEVKTPAPKQPTTETKKQTPAEQKEPSKKEAKGLAKSEKKIHDYHEQKVVVNSTVFINPLIEKINSIMMINVNPNWWENKDCICKDSDLVWGNKINCDERKKVKEVSKNLDIDPNWLMTVIALETIETFSPSIDNGIGYVGLIQFGESSASTIGTTQSLLVKMSFIEQMNYVQKYLMPKKNLYKTLTDLYLAVIYPTACGHGSEKDYVVLNGNAYRSNPLFFKEKGEWEWATKVNNKGKTIKYKKPTDPDGNTYVWEIEMVTQEIFTKGLNLKATIFSCENETIISKGNCLETWDTATNIRIDKLHPKIRCATKNFINEVEKTMGIKLRIIQGYRTYAEQDALYKQRPKVTNAKGGESNHNFGLAIDVAEIKNGSIDWAEQEIVLPKIAPIGKKWGFEWGGEWKSFVDKPHFEMTFGKQTRDLKELCETYNNDYTKIPL